MISLNIDTVGLLPLQNMLEALPEKVRSAIPGILNTAGSSMRRETGELVARDIGEGVSSAEVISALDPSPATSDNLEYSITSDSRQFGYVRWITMRDEKVCPICARMDGKLFRRDAAKLVWPGHPKNCRCELEPIALGEYVSDATPIVLPRAQAKVFADIVAVFRENWHT
jgi:hypothetical protein